MALPGYRASWRCASCSCAMSWLRTVTMLDVKPDSNLPSVCQVLARSKLTSISIRLLLPMNTRTSPALPT